MDVYEILKQRRLKEAAAIFGKKNTEKEQKKDADSK